MTAHPDHSIEVVVDNGDIKVTRIGADVTAEKLREDMKEVKSMMIGMEWWRIAEAVGLLGLAAVFASSLHNDEHLYTVLSVVGAFLLWREIKSDEKVIKKFRNHRRIQKAVLDILEKREAQS